jgi:WS/DGAT/MGAT family acyltransferase
MWTGMMHGRESMSKVDTAWLRMEGPTNLMMITGVMVLREPLSLVRLKHIVSARFLSYRRFRQRVLDLGAQAFWEDAADFDLDQHVSLLKLPAGAGHAELQECVSKLASTALDQSRPLWQFQLIPHYAGGSAVVVRIHHCYADGMALVQVMLALTDRDARVRKDVPAAPSPMPDTSFFDRLLAPARQGIDQVSGLIDGARKAAAEFGQHPQATAESLAAKAKSGLRDVADIARELGAALLLPDDPDTPFKGRLGATKRVAWCAPLPLDEVKAVGKALDATVNDILLACAAGALRGYLKDIGSPVDGVTIRASVPVNLRSAAQSRELGNHFGLVFLSLPIGEANPLARLAAVRQSMRELKGSKQAMVTFGLLSALGMSPASLQKPAFELLSRKATTVATNVPGPTAPLFLAGSAIEQMLFWVPQTGSIGMGISIFSYAGQVQFGLICDTELVPDPERISDRFGPELEKLVLLALMADGEEPITPEHADASLRHFTAVRPIKSAGKARVQRKRSKVRA